MENKKHVFINNMLYLTTQNCYYCGKKDVPLKEMRKIEHRIYVCNSHPVRGTEESDSEIAGLEKAVILELRENEEGGL